VVEVTADPVRAAGAYRPGYELVAERLRAMILESGLHPGDKLPTVEALSIELGVGRKVVLEAVRLLSANHYVRVRRGSGVYVSDNPSLAHALIRLPLPCDPDGVEYLFAFRASLEEESARLAAENATPRELRAIKEAAARSRRGAEHADEVEFNAGDSALHLAVATATHNVYFVCCVDAAHRMQREAVCELLKGVIPGSLINAGLEHQAIYEAIRDGRPEAAAAASRQHVDTTLENYRAEVRRRVAGPMPSGSG
jgi:GntR family transcriptional repressor for pyruvate dehydrogenase complex